MNAFQVWSFIFHRGAEETHSQNNFAGYKMQKQIVCKELKKKERSLTSLNQSKPLFKVLIMKPLLFNTWKTAAQINPVPCWSDRALPTGSENRSPIIMKLSAQSDTAVFQNTPTAERCAGLLLKIPVALVQMRSANLLRAEYSLAMNSGWWSHISQKHWMAVNAQQNQGRQRQLNKARQRETENFNCFNDQFFTNGYYII